MVDVDLGEGDLAFGSMIFGQFREDGRNGAARWTPVCVKVHHHVLCGGEEGVKLGRLGNLLDLLRRLGNRGATGRQGLVKSVFITILPFIYNYSLQQDEQMRLLDAYNSTKAKALSTRHMCRETLSDEL